MDRIADVERLLERVFERTTARVFRARVQVVQVERKVERSMERARAAHGNRTTVPSRYRVRLHPADLESLAHDTGGADALAGTLADAALAFARAHGYHLAGRPVVAIVADPIAERGVVEVDAVPDAARPAPSPAEAPQPPADVPSAPAVAAAPAADQQLLHDRPAPSVAVAVGAVAEPEPLLALEPSPVSTGIRGDGTQTMVYRRPAPETARAVLRVIVPGAPERTVEVGAAPLTIGRSKDNGLVLADQRVSRHHARLQTRRGTLVYADLASTNGSRVNGIRVDECALGVGDRVLLGDTVLLVELLPG